MNRVPLHEFEKAQKRKKFWDNVLMSVFGVVLLTGVTFVGWLLWMAGVALLPYPELFWGIIIFVSVIIIVWVSSVQYKKYSEIVDRGEKEGTIDE